jgi:hypothetical protein
MEEEHPDVDAGRDGDEREREDGGDLVARGEGGEAGAGRGIAGAGALDR